MIRFLDPSEGLSCSVVGAVALLLVLVACGGEPDPAASEAQTSDPQISVRAPTGTRTPVILVSVDTLRSDRLPAYGYDRIETPAIDSFRSEAILFERAYTHMALTLPSHISVLSGRWPVDHGVRDNIGYRVAEDTPLLQETLGQAGYETFGAVSAFVLRGTTGLARGFDHYDDGIAVTSGTELGSLQRSGLSTLEETVRLLEDRDPERPPFLFFHIYEPHTPNDPPEPFRSRYPSAYDGEVAEADLVVGRLFEALRGLELYDDALIIFLSDHGEGLNDHGEYEHEVFLYREVIQVPLIVRLPGGRRGGTTVSEPVQLTDVVPTVHEVLGLEPPGGLSRGVSLFSELDGERPVFSESIYPRIHFGWSDLASMVEDRYHFIQAPSPELYDLISDPGERNNIVQQERAVARRLSAALDEIDRSIAPPAAVDEETRARMESLGYVAGGAGRSGPLPDPKDRVEVLEDLGSAATALAAGEFEEAARRYRSVVETDPGMVYAWEQLGKAERRSGDLREALEAYETAVARSPTGSGPAALSIAEIQLELGALDLAEEHARIAAATQDAAHDLLAQIALRRGDLEEARRRLELAIERRSGRIEPLVTRVSLLVEEERYRDALAAADEVISEFGDRTDTEVLEGLEFERGRALAELRRLEEAAAAFRREIERSPEELAPYTFLSLALALQGDAEGATGALRSMVERNPTPEAYAEAVRALRALGDPQGAAALLRNARSRFPGAAALAEL